MSNSIGRRLAAFLGIGRWNTDESGRLRKGDFIQTYTGAWVYVLDPVGDEIHYDDICVALSRECRYANHSQDFYSVAEHSVIVSEYCERLARERGWSDQDVLDVAREGLLHDATEAYLGDVPRPLKRQRAYAFSRTLEARWWKVICERFGIRSTPASAALVKEVDERLLADEMEVLLLAPERVRAWRPREIRPLGAVIAALPWEQAADVFSQRFAALFPELVDDYYESFECEQYDTIDEETPTAFAEAS